MALHTQTYCTCSGLIRHQRKVGGGTVPLGDSRAGEDSAPIVTGLGR